MKIAVVTQYYYPEPVPIAQSVAQGLAARGHDVTVITAFPNYPSGRLYPGYRQTRRHSEADGPVRVLRVPIFLSHSQNALGRILNYLSFAWNSYRAGAAVNDVDVVYCYATQMTAAIGPAWWRRRRGIPFVMHVQDLWPESVTGSSMVGGRRLQALIARTLRPWLESLYRGAAATIGIGPSMSRILVDRGVAPERIHTIYNWAQTTDLSIVRSEPSAEGTLSVMYAGNIGEMQDLDTVIRAAALVTDLEGLSISIVGSGVAEARITELARKAGLANVRFFGRVPFSEMAEHYARSDFQLVTLKDLDIFKATIPSKLQASLAIGAPVITTVAGDVGELVSNERVGFCSEPGNPEALAEAFRRAYATSPDERAAMGRRARDLYESTMSRESGLDQIESILASARRTPATKRTTS